MRGKEYKGVHYYKPNGMWVARYKRYHIGYYLYDWQAALAYNAFAYKKDGIKVYLNTVDGFGKSIMFKLKERILTSKYRGIDKRKYSYRVAIQVNNKRQHIGHFPTEQEAVWAYNTKCYELGIPERVQEYIS